MRTIGATAGAAMLMAGTASYGEGAAPLLEALRSLDGKEVVATGTLMRLHAPGQYSFHIGEPDALSSFRVISALGRDDLDAVETCIGPGRGSCIVDVSAELRMTGGAVTLLIYDVDNLAPLN